MDRDARIPLNPASLAQVAGMPCGSRRESRLRISCGADRVARARSALELSERGGSACIRSAEGTRLDLDANVVAPLESAPARMLERAAPPSALRGVGHAPVSSLKPRPAVEPSAWPMSAAPAAIERDSKSPETAAQPRCQTLLAPVHNTLSCREQAPDCIRLDACRSSKFRANANHAKTFRSVGVPPTRKLWAFRGAL